jgi:predicted dienelactone hydrolase
MRPILPVLSAALVLGACAGPVAAAASPAAAATPVQLTVPAPTGPDHAGVISLELTDRSRTVPWMPGRQVRRLMISIWYPAHDTARYPAAPWLEPGAAAHFEQAQRIPPGTIRVPVTTGHVGAPADRERGGHPVVLFSPADRLDRTIDTALVEDLTSHGYIVVTIDHTYDSGEVEFPDGQVVVSTLPPDSDQVNTEATAVRVADTKFVLGQLAKINAGYDPDAGSRLPRGLAGALDLSEVGMFGFSMGGAATAGAMLADPQIKAGADLDGTIYGPVAAKGLNRPFLLVSSQDNGRNVDPTWASLWSHLRGWRLDLRLAGAEHLSFSDAVTLYHQAAAVLHLTRAQLAGLVGTIGGTRAVAIERAYLRAFFDLQLRHHDDGLLDHPSAAYPEMRFVP